MTIRQGPLRLTLIYLLAAGSWIFFSDTLLTTLGLTAHQLERLQLLKGMGFVVLTSLLLFLILRSHRHAQRGIRRALRASENRLSLALDAAQDGLWDWNLRTQEIYYSPRYAAMLGLAPDELGNSRERWLARLHPDDRNHYREVVEQHLQRATPTSYENTYRLRHADGSYRWIRSRGRLQMAAHGEPERFIGTVTDITQKRADEDSLRQAAAVFDATQEGVLVSDANQTIVHINPAFSRITGYSEAEIIGQHPNLLKSGRHDATFYQAMWHALQHKGAWSGEIWNRRKNGEIYPQWQCIRAIHNEKGLISHYVAVFSDITALKRSQRELDYLAHHDPLSNLPNRLLFTERVEHAIERARREQQSGAVLLIDLDHFKH
ncbi:MAG TPA: PAS domain-containing protein, partial [Pseudomonas sp.]|nr:PAS domain-containing protein [Pseudomonas sp.]